MDIDIINRYVKGEASKAETAYVESLLEEGQNNLLLKQILENDWNGSQASTSQYDSGLVHLLDKIHHNISVAKNKKEQRALSKFVRIYSRIAAILILPVAVGAFILLGYRERSKSNDNEVSASIFAPMGSRVTFNLPDGTKGVLNSGSKLTYTLPFGEKRNIKLEGEAWFEVKHDSVHPFLVSAGHSTVKVVGTSFNLSTYPNEDYIEVVLKEGRVKFIPESNNNELVMAPMERLIFKNGEVRKSVVDPDKYSAWTEGKLVFRSDPMAEVVRRIERWYNVRIKIEDRDLDKYTFRATFQDDKLEDVIKFLAMTSPITYKIIPRKLLPDGTLQKEEIRIYKSQ